LPGARNGPDNLFGQQDLTGGTTIIADGGQAFASVNRLFWSNENGGTFINRGTIWNVGAANSFTLGGWYLDIIENYGLIVAEAQNGNAEAVFVGSGGDYVYNEGQIFALAKGNAIGVEHWQPGVIVTNLGLIAAYASGPSTGGAGGVGDAIALALYNGGAIANDAGAAILAEGVTATAVIINEGTIRNAGRIEAYATGGTLEATAILSAALTQASVTVENSGLIRADVAYYSTSEYGFSPPQQPTDHIVNLAGGEIYGRIETRLGADIIDNAGAIHGTILLGEGADRLDSINGTLDGYADLGWGTDDYRAGGGADAAMGGRDSDVMDGGGGQDLLLGGLGDDTLLGGAGNDALYGEYGDDRIVTAGGDRVDGGAGDDRIELGDYAFASVDGGAGDDRLVLAAGARALDLSASLATGRLHDIETVELRGQQRLVVRAGDVTGLTGGETAMRFFTTGSDKLELVGAWAELSSQFLQGITYRRFALGSEIALVAGSANVSVAGAPSAPASGLGAIAGGSAPPGLGAVPGVGLASAVTVLNNYNLHATETVQAYETWRSDDGQPLLWTYGWDYSVVNYGLMESTGAGNGGARVMMVQQMDRFVNYGTARATGPGATVIDDQNVGGLTNHGLIEAISDTVSATGVNIRNAVWDDFNFLNYGTISARTTSAERAVGAEIWLDDAAYNYGEINAVGGDGTVGAIVTQQRMFTNAGTIVATLGAGRTGSTTGLFYMSSPFGFTFHNEGLIRGTKAIDTGTAIGYPPGPAVFYNHGRLEGSITLDEGDSHFENWGTILGDAHLGGGTNFWFGAGGTQQGALYGGEGADILVGTAVADQLNGEAGDDYLLGGLGADQLNGGAGRDIFIYTKPSESTAAAFDTIGDFTSGTDRIDLTALGVQSVSIQASGGTSILTATTALGLLEVHVSGALAQSDLVLSALPTLTGTGDADLLVATAGGSVLSGGGGRDVLAGAAGGDRLDGGAGADRMWGGGGDDVYVVDSEIDLVWEVAGQGIDRIEVVEAGVALTMPDNVENATLSQFGFIRGNALSNLIQGSGGDDTLDGGEGNDRVIGGAGNVRVSGGGGYDRLEGGAGADLFTFYTSADSHPAAARSDGAKIMPDIITDFVQGTDRIDLSNVDAVAGGDQFGVFTFIGTDAFTHQAGQLRFEASGNQTAIYADIDGDGTADMQILLLAPVALTGADFLL
jgi:Ca2+-binding RTX toxin-like protein